MWGWCLRTANNWVSRVVGGSIGIGIFNSLNIKLSNNDID